MLIADKKDYRRGYEKHYQSYKRLKSENADINSRRLLFRRAVSECSNDKIGEIRDEIKALGPIFDKLEHASEEKKVLPFKADTFNLTQAEEKIMKQEGYLKIGNDRYYLPEIIRHALKFKYEKGARPKVLSLLLK